VECRFVPARIVNPVSPVVSKPLRHSANKTAGKMYEQTGKNTQSKFSPTPPRQRETQHPPHCLRPSCHFGGHVVSLEGISQSQWSRLVLKLKCQTIANSCSAQTRLKLSEIKRRYEKQDAASYFNVFFF